MQLDSIGEIVEVVPDKALLGAEPTAAAFKIFDTVLEKVRGRVGALGLRVCVFGEKVPVHTRWG